jgi:hypothetical protein
MFLLTVAGKMRYSIASLAGVRLIPARLVIASSMAAHSVVAGLVAALPNIDGINGNILIVASRLCLLRRR